jgi:hypothetical protein
LDNKTLALIEVVVLGFAEAKRYESFKKTGEVRDGPESLTNLIPSEGKQGGGR